jgi:hypothetical protein
MYAKDYYKAFHLDSILLLSHYITGIKGPLLLNAIVDNI